MLGLSTVNIKNTLNKEAFHCNGTSSALYIDPGTCYISDTDSAFTIQFWAQLKDTGASYEAIVTCNIGTNKHWTLGIANQNNLKFEVKNGSAKLYAYTQSNTLNSYFDEWVHYVITYDPSGSTNSITSWSTGAMRFYANGVDMNSVTNPKISQVIMPTMTSYHRRVEIGKFSGVVYGGPYWIADFALIPQYFDATGVLNMYRAGFGNLNAHLALESTTPDFDNDKVGRCYYIFNQKYFNTGSTEVDMWNLSAGEDYDGWLQDLFNRNMDGHLTPNVKDVDLVAGSSTNQIAGYGGHSTSNVTINGESFVKLTMQSGGNALFSSATDPALSHYTTLAGADSETQKKYIIDMKVAVDAPGGTKIRPLWWQNLGNLFTDTNDEVIPYRFIGDVGTSDSFGVWTFQSDMVAGDSVSFRIDSIRRASGATWYKSMDGPGKKQRPSAPWEWTGVGEYSLDTATFPY